LPLFAAEIILSFPSIIHACLRFLIAMYLRAISMRVFAVFY
jgi:hypothetical protein